MKRAAEPDLDLFAITAPGLEAICAAELADLAIAGKVVTGGVEWRGGLGSVYRANLESRTASRIVARAGRFRARSFHELERHIARIEWPRFVPAGGRVALRITARKSKLYHEGAIADRIIRELADCGVSAVRLKKKAEDEDIEAEADAQLVIVRFMRDECTVSIDASGALLHQRGYRQAIAKAPLRETMAAAILLASGWRGDTALLDPMCGSGTIVIEGALIARRIAPGLARATFEPRDYACLRWPLHDARSWRDVVASARAAIRPDAGVIIQGSDTSAGAVTAAAQNAERAGVRNDIVLERRGLAAVVAPAEKGHVVTNPPYGVRVGERRELYGLYAALGRVAREQLAGWQVGFLAADDRLAAATGLALENCLTTRNGGIPVKLLYGPGTPITL